MGRVVLEGGKKKGFSSQAMIHSGTFKPVLAENCEMMRISPPVCAPNTDVGSLTWRQKISVPQIKMMYVCLRGTEVAGGGKKD